MDVLQTPASPGERTNCRGLQPPAGLTEVYLKEASLFFMSTSFKESFKVLTGENLSDFKKTAHSFSRLSVSSSLVGALGELLRRGSSQIKMIL